MTPRPTRRVAVAVPVPVRRSFTYGVPESLAVAVGARVRVPFGRRRLVGTVVELDPPEPVEVRLKPIEAVLEGAPAPNAEVLSLARFVADYYQCSLGEAIEAALPPDVSAKTVDPVVRFAAGEAADARVPSRAKAQRALVERLAAHVDGIAWSKLDASERRAARALETRGIVELGHGDTSPTASGEPLSIGEGPEPTPAQAEVLRTLLPEIGAGSYRTFVLFGPTGSGKTEIYLRAAVATLEAGLGVLYLVPEIGLTPLLVSRLRERFGASVDVLHSGLAAGRRRLAWERVRSGECRFVVGTRSAVFAPVRELGLVVVDEEHDASYKQDETPRYNGRDVAIVRARDAGAIALLGSATPSLETFRHARSGRYTLLPLRGRVLGRRLAAVDVVDMRREYTRSGEVRVLSEPLAEAIRDAVGSGDQVLVLRNRRGWAAAVHCPSCGNRVLCRACSIAMTWHRAAARLRCHACGEDRPELHACPYCRAEDIRLLGEGTERVEAELRDAVPGVRVARMDRDTVRRREEHEQMLRAFDRGGIDVLVGTQMIAKGHDFPRVTLVGVLAADHGLGLPDFRAGERTFQLLTQVAGRAGRGERPGRVILQAFEPDHPVVRHAAEQDYEAFYEREIEYRRALRYPPFSALVRIVVQDRDLGRVVEWSERVAEAVRACSRGRLIVAGPGPAPVDRLRDRFRHQILIRSAGRRRMVRAVREALDAVETDVPRRAIVVDVDAQSIL